MKRGGISTLELLVVVAVLAILLGIGTPNYLRWRASSVTFEAAQQFARDVDKQRTLAKRENESKALNVPSNGTSYTLLDGDLSSATSRSVSLPAGIEIAPLDSNTGFTFEPPFGAIAETPSKYDFEIRWQANPNIKRTVRVTTVLGKVIIQ